MENTYEGYPSWVKDYQDKCLCEGDIRSVWRGEYMTDRYLLTRVQDRHDFHLDVQATLHGIPVDKDTMKPFHYGEIFEVLPGIYDCDKLARSIQKKIFDVSSMRISEMIDGVEIMVKFDDMKPGQIVQIETGPTCSFGGGQRKTWSELTDEERCFADQFDADSTIVSVRILQKPSLQKKARKKIS